MKETIAKLLEYNPLDRNILKVVEETTELNEVLIKFITKKPELKPPIEKIIEEAGDTIFRLKVLLAYFKIEDEVEKRVAEKALQIDKWMKEMKYKNGV